MIRDELWAVVTESWAKFWSLDEQLQKMIMGGIAAAILIAIAARKVMVPYLLLAFGVAFYLRRSRGSDSL